VAGRRSRDESPYLERSQALSSLLLHRRTHVLKISRRELSERTGVSTSNIQAIETGRTVEPGLFTVISLATALDLDLGEMMRTRTGPLRAKSLKAEAIGE
jgi:transcriptional regulator with XRE-family HTH domain